MLKKLSKLWISFAIIFSLLFSFVFFNSNANFVANAASEESPTLTTSDNANGTNWTWNAENKILTLSGIDWNSTFTVPDNATTINVSGSNKISVSDSYVGVVESNSPDPVNLTINFTDTGSLILEATGSESYAFDAYVNVTFSAPTAGTKKIYTSSTDTVGTSTFETSFKTSQYLKFEYTAPAHTHSFSYSTSGNTLTATCSATDCSLHTSPVSIALSVDDIVFGGTPTKTLSGLDAFNTATGKTISLSSFDEKYYSVDSVGATTGGTLVSGEISSANAGNYYLELTPKTDADIGTDAIVCAFKITKADLTLSGTDKTTTYSGTNYDLTQLFNFDAISSISTAKFYTIESDGTNGEGTVFDETKLIITKCGDFKIKLTATPLGQSNYKETTLIKKLTVSRADLASLSVSVDDWYYLADAKTPTVSNNAGSGAVTYTYYTDALLTNKTTSTNGAETDGGVPSKVGKYYLKAEVAQTNLYNAGTASTADGFVIWAVPTLTADLTSTIQYKDLITSASDGKTYDVSSLFEIDSNAGAASYELVVDDVPTTIVDGILKNITIGSYEIKLSVAQNDSTYYASTAKTTTLVVEKDTLALSISVAGWNYNESASTPSTSGNTYSGTETIKYYRDSNFTEEVSSPSALGKYYAKYSVAETDYSKAGYATCEFTISSTPVTIVWSDDDFTYNGLAQTVTAKYVVDANTEISLSVSFGVDVNFLNAGNYTATATFPNEYSYYTASNSTKSFTIKKRDLTVEIQNLRSGAGVIIKLKANNTIGEIVAGDETPYSLLCDATTSSAPGVYPITGTCTNDNYNITFVSATYTIYNNVKVSIDDWNYLETAKTPTVTATVGAASAVITYSLDSEENWSTTVPTEPGTYICRAVVTDAVAYNCGEGIADFRIKKLTVVAPAKDSATHVYTGVSQTYNIIESALDYTVEGNSRINAGSYNVTISLVDSAHYMWSSSDENINETSTPITYVFTINKKSIEKPVADNTNFVYTGQAQTYRLTENDNYVISNNISQTEPGTYDIVVTLKDTNNYQWSDSTTSALHFEFVIKQSKIENPTTVDASGKTMTTNPVVIVATDGKGISPDVQMQVKVFDDEDNSKIKAIETQMKSVLKEYDKIFGVYDVSLLCNDAEVQPDGKITLKMAVPEEIRNSNFKLYHIHTDSSTGAVSVFEIDCGSIDKDGNITFQIDKLSSFAFVSEQTSLAWLINILKIADIALGAIFFVLLVLFIIKVKNSRKMTKTMVAAPVFFVASEVKLSIILGVLAGILVIADIVFAILLIVFSVKSKHKKKEKTVEELDEIDEEKQKADDKSVDETKEETPKQTKAKEAKKASKTSKAKVEKANKTTAKNKVSK